MAELNDAGCPRGPRRKGVLCGSPEHRDQLAVQNLHLSRCEAGVGTDRG